MSDTTTPDRPTGPLNPQALRLADAARVLSASGPTSVTVEMLQADRRRGRAEQRRRDAESGALRRLVGQAGEPGRSRSFVRE